MMNAMSAAKDRLDPAASVKGLRAKSAQWRGRQNRLAIALGVVLVLGALAVYLPLRNTLAQTRETIRTTELELTANRERAAQLPQLRASVETLERRVRRYKPLRPAADLALAMQELSDVKERTRPEKYRLDSLPLIRHASCVEQPLRLTFDADFVDALSFIGRVESMDRLTRVRDISITRLGDLNGKGGRVNVAMSLSLFFADASTAVATAGGDR